MLNARREVEHPRQETILLVDDNEELRVLTAGLLRSKGYQVLEAESAEKAISLSDLHSGEIHLVIADLRLPRMNGFELIQHLTGLPNRARLKGLLFSGHVVDDLDGKLFPKSSVHFLEKPCARGILFEKVSTVLGA